MIYDIWHMYKIQQFQSQHTQYLWHLSRLLFLLSLILSALKSNDSANLMSLITISSPFVEAFQRLQLNLFIHSNKVFVSNLYVCVHAMDHIWQKKVKRNYPTTYHISKIPWPCYQVSTLPPQHQPDDHGGLSHDPRHSCSRYFALEQLFTSMYPCMCGQELQWREVGGWRWARCRSSWRRRSSASCWTHWWTWWSTQALL